MIDLDSKFFSTIVDFKNNLNDNDKDLVLNSCVKNRILDIVKLQSEILDDNLADLQKSLNFNFKDIRDIQKLTGILESLYKCIAKDRLKLFNILINLSEDS